MRTGECQVGCGACCRFLVLQVNPQYIEVDDVRRWIELHGIKLRMRDGGCWATIPLPCSALEEGRCSLYGSEERPKTCDVFPSSQADIDLVHEFTGEEVCTYRFPQEG